MTSIFISLGGYAGRTDVTYQGTARLASWPGSGDAAVLAIDVLGAGGQVLTSKSSGAVSNPANSGFAFHSRALSGQLPAGAASVRLTLSFPVSYGYSGGFADDISFKLN